MADKGTIPLRASTRGARRAGFKLSTGGRKLQRIILDEFGGRLAPSLTRIARDFAPHDKGALERGLKGSVTSRGGRITVQLISTARSEKGYDYLGVTRFGHRKRFIYPHPPRRFLAWRARSGKMIFRRRVRGYKPAGDWVEHAKGSFDGEVAASSRRIARTIDTRLL